MSTTATNPYVVSTADLPSRNDMTYADWTSGFRDLYDQNTVSVSPSSNAEYDGAWLRLEGTFHVEEGVEIREYSPAFEMGGKRFPPTLLCEGWASANMDRASLLRLRNAIDLLLQGMEWKPGTEPQA